MGKLLVLALCCSMLAAVVGQEELDRNLLSFQDKPKQGHIEALKDNYVKQLFSQLLGRKLAGPSQRGTIRGEQSVKRVGLSSLEDLNASKNGPAMNDEALILHHELQNRLGWGSGQNDMGFSNGPPPPPNRQRGPPKQHYGPPPSQPNQQYGPPPSQPNQQYGPPPSQPNQQYGPPPSQPNQQYGPPPSPPNQQYGPPPSQSNQQYGPPASVGPGIRVNQGTFGGHIENFQLSDAVTKNKNNAYSPPQQNQNAPLANDISTFNNDMAPKIYKHVFIHTPPSNFDPEVEQPRVIRPNKKQDTHYQIIFVKAPTPKQVPTEIELPSPPQRKSLIYVLVKKPEKPEIKFIQPKPTQVSKPEVYFIRYKGNKNNGGLNEGVQGQGYSDTLSNVDEDGGYSSSYNDDSQSQILGGKKTLDTPVLSVTNDRIRESVGYPDTEYRAQPIMLNPNLEPMSISVYDRVRNGVMPSNSGGNRGSLNSAASSISVRVERRQGSHYTAPGSKPFVRASGKMLNGQYIGMTSNMLKSQYYTADNQRK